MIHNNPEVAKSSLIGAGLILKSKQQELEGPVVTKPCANQFRKGSSIMAASSFPGSLSIVTILYPLCSSAPDFRNSRKIGVLTV